MNGLVLASGSSASGGRLAGVMTSTTPGWLLAPPAASREVDAAARDAADRQYRVQHAGRVVVRGVAGLAPDLEDAVAAGQRLADTGAVADMGGVVGEA